MNKAAIVASLLVFALPAHAQSGGATITIKHGVSNNQADPAGAKEIALKDTLASACDGKSECSLQGPKLVPSGQFMIEVIYECRDASGSARQIGPKQFNGTQNVELNCL